MSCLENLLPQNKEIRCYLVIAMLVVIGWYLLQGVNEQFSYISEIEDAKIPYGLKMDDNRKPEIGTKCACEYGHTHRKIDIDRSGSNNMLSCTCAECDYYNQSREQDFLGMVNKLRKEYNPKDQGRLRKILNNLNLFLPGEINLRFPSSSSLKPV